MNYKLPNELHKFFRIDTPFQDFNEFFDKYTNGKRHKNGIYQRYVGYMNDITFFWLEDEEFPFAYTFPRTVDEDFRQGYIFYIIDNK